MRWLAGPHKKQKEKKEKENGQEFIRAVVFFRKGKTEIRAALTASADGLSPNQVAVRMKRRYYMYFKYIILYSLKYNLYPVFNYNKYFLIIYQL